MSEPGRVVLITGASSGIGLATAQALSQGAWVGTRVFAVGRGSERLRSAASALGAVALAADLGNPGDVKSMGAELARQTDHLDVLVNCAGQLEVGPAQRLGPEVAERLMRVNFLGTVATIHACVPLLRRGRAPVIVNVSSVAGRVAPPYMAAYAASKFAVNGYTHALRQELQREGIHVGLVMPGPVATPMVEGRLGGEYYPRMAGVPVLSARRVAEAIVRVVERRLPEVVLPRRLGAAVRLGSAYPGVVDAVYRRTGVGGHAAADAPVEIAETDAERTDLETRRYGSDDSILWWE